MYYDNLAYDYEVLETQKPRKTRQPKKVYKPRKSKRRLALAVFCIFAISFLLYYRYAVEYGLNSDISSKRQVLNKLQSENSKIAMEIEQELEKGRLYSYAVEKLGMNKPTSSQIVYVNIDKSGQMQKVEDNHFKIGEFIGKIAFSVKDYFF